MIGLTLVLVLALAGPTQEPTLADVLRRAGAYVEEFRRQLAGIVAEEHYVQDALAFNERNKCAADGMFQSAPNCREQSVRRRRTDLKSDLLLVRTADGNRWAEFRDVFEADGVPVRDRAERLTKLFLGHDPASSRQMLGQILHENSRFNIGDIQRNINTPIFSLQVLEPMNQSRFKFSRSNKRTPDTFARENAATGAFRTSTEIWVVEFRETETPTIVRTDERRDFPVRGRFWIEPATGRVLMSELVARNRTLDATIDVSFQSEPLFGLLVPIEMREEYKDRGGSHITAVATYGRFRRFVVNVNETFLIKE